MNYEKRYKAALERAKEMCATPTDKATMEYIFPELAESGDERIIRELCNDLLLYVPTPERYIAWLEKQGKKPTDKIDTKFKVGDWIVQENIGVYKVIEICESWYEVVDNKDKHYSIGFDKEYMCHLWTIDDAQ